MEPLVARALRPHRIFLDRGSERWRPGFVVSIAGPTCQIRVLQGVGFPLTFQGQTADLASIGAAEVEAPLAVRMSGTGTDAAPVAIHGAIWGGHEPTPGFVARGEDRWPFLPREITGESEFYDETDNATGAKDVTAWEGLL